MTAPNIDPMPQQAVVLRRNKETATRCEEILGLPNGRWSDVQIEFGTDNVAMASVRLFLTPWQLVALAELASEGVLRAEG